MERRIWEHAGIESPALLRCHGETFRRRAVANEGADGGDERELTGWWKPNMLRRWQHGKQRRLVAGCMERAGCPLALIVTLVAAIMAGVARKGNRPMRVVTFRKNECVRIGDALFAVAEIRGDKVRLRMVARDGQSAQREEDLNFVCEPLIDPAWLAWNDCTVVRLARAIAQEGNYGVLPILADALEEAGCVDATILGHCRSCGQDVRNSWVVNRILAAS